jgi:flagellin
MALVVNTNVAAIQAQYNVSKTNQSMQDAMAALSSGSRINSASDDAAGLSISSRMDSQIRGLTQAIRNANDGINMVDTAEGAMDEITNMLQRMRELALQSATDTNTLEDRQNLDAEVQQLKAEIDRVSSTTLFNNQSLLDGSYASKTLQIGSEASQTLALSIGNMSTTALGTSAVGSGVSGVTSNTASGTEATETVSQIAFNGNDTYGFTLTIGEGDGATTEALTIANASVVGNDAQDVADKINTAISAAVTANTLASGVVSASANGNVVTIRNAVGDSVAVSSFTSTANGTASYSSISGSGSSVLLDETAAVTSATNSGGGAASTASGSLTLQAGKDYSFRLNGTLIDITNLGTTTSEADALAAMKLAIGDGGAGSTVAGQVFSLQDTTGNEIEITNFTAASSPTGSVGSMVMTVRVDADSNTPSNTYANGGSDTTDIDGTDIVQFSFTEAEADYAFDIGGQSFTVATASAGATLAEALATTRDAINANATLNPSGSETVAARVVDGKLEIENLNTAGTAITVDNYSSTGKAAVTAGTATLGATNLVTQGTGSTTNGTVAIASEMTMQFSEDDSYSFQIGGQTITATIAGGSLANVISAVNSESNNTGVTASESNGLLLLTNASGGAINVTSFSSTGTGTVNVANAAGQGTSVILDDTAAVTGGSTAAAGRAEATVMDLTLDATDDLTFKISDGRTVAIVRKTSWDPTNNAAMLAEIQSALSNVGSDISAATTGAGAKITLTNSKGGAIELTNFTSDSTGIMTATPAQGQGVGKLLNDDGITGSQAAVSAIAVVDQAGANASVDTIDRAIEQINAERSKLGAVSNRLDYTVSNLGNIVSNTAASRSQIEDADFAAESANLAKNQILLQAGTAMLAQANASQQTVLSLLG